MNLSKKARELLDDAVDRAMENYMSNAMQEKAPEGERLNALRKIDALNQIARQLRIALDA